MPIHYEEIGFCSINIREKSNHFYMKNIDSGNIPDNFSRFSEKRKSEFLAGRYCATMAIDQLSLNSNKVLLVMPDRAPIWPIGLIGSITHTDNFASAIAFSSTDYLSVGIDCETIIEIGKAEKISSLVMTISEFALFSGAKIDFNLLCSIIFSSKESIYKCLYQITKVEFYFQDAEIVNIDFSEKIFEFRLIKKLSDKFDIGYHGFGSYIVFDNYIHTSVIVS